mmetsp:Transcript_30826/g.73509  ORF Transcript_30826/g.73509 Transcript_30826/m.73509 type:complete len:208 (+) Transcript_30826:664-1287(+)
MRICIFQVGSVLHVPGISLCWKTLTHFLHSLQVSRGLAQPLLKCPEVLCDVCHDALGNIGHQDRQLADGQVPEVLQLLEGVQQVQVILERGAKLVRKDWQSGQGHQRVAHILVTKNILQLLLSELLRRDDVLHGLERRPHRGRDHHDIDLVKLVVINLSCGQDLNHITTTGCELRLARPACAWGHACPGAHCCHAQCSSSRASAASA